jgi:hypothetical protein
MIGKKITHFLYNLYQTGAISKTCLCDLLDLSEWKDDEQFLAHAFKLNYDIDWKERREVMSKISKFEDSFNEQYKKTEIAIQEKQIELEQLIAKRWVLDQVRAGMKEKTKGNNLSQKQK